MTDFILFLVIVAECGLISWLEYNNRKERQKLIQAIMSRSASDLANFEFVDKIKSVEPNPVVDNSDLINISDLTDEEFQKNVIDKEVG